MTTHHPGDPETAAEMAAALASGEVSSVELVELALERAEAWQQATNAFTQRWPEEAAASARASDERRTNGAAFGPHDGVPVAVKDLFDVAGHETTGCSRAFAGRVATADARVVTRLRDAGLVLIGKTNQHELAAGGTNLVSAFGRTGNPWDPARITGGSSGGSAAAVAAGVVPWALGSDTGGSIRIPSSMCGTFGLKPTTGRWPLDGVMPLSPSMDCPGPLAGTAEDLWALADLLDGHRTPARDASEGLPTVGVVDGFYATHLHPDTLSAVATTARALEAAGVRTLALDGSGLDGVRDIWSAVCCSEFADALAPTPEQRARIHPDVLAWIEKGERLTPLERSQALTRRQDVAAWFARALEGVDALLVPTTPYPAYPADARTVAMAGEVVDVAAIGPGRLTCPVNLAGLPAVNLPAAFTAGGLPVGVSLVARANAEPMLRSLTALWAEGFEPRRPSLPS